MPWLVRKNNDGKFCVYKKDPDGSPIGPALGCHGNEAEANGQIKALYANVKESEIWVTQEQMRALCPSCAGHMQKSNLLRVNLAQVQGAGFSEALCDAFGDFEGFRTRCMDSALGQAADDAGAICNALKEFCFGSVSRSQASLRSIAAIGESSEEGDKWDVVVLKLGKSLREPYFVFSREGIESSLAVFDGAKVYALSNSDDFGHSRDSAKKSTKDIVGSLSDPRLVGDELHATLHILPSATWLKDNLLYASKNNLPFPYELSIDARVDVVEGKHENEKLPIVTKITYSAVDVVERGAAGGRFMKMVASISYSGGKDMKNKLLFLFSLLYPTFLEEKKVDMAAVNENELYTHLLAADKPQPRLNLPQGMDENAVDAAITRVREAMLRDDGSFFKAYLEKVDKLLSASPPQHKKEPDSAPALEAVKESFEKQLAKVKEDADTRILEMERRACSAILTERLRDSKLPVPLQDELKARFSNRIFREPELMEAIDSTRKTYGRLIQSMPNSRGMDINIGLEQDDKIRLGLDGFFLSKSLRPLTPEEQKEMLKGVPPYRSFKQAYIDFTGDADVTGMKKYSTRLTESLQTTDWAEVTASALNKRLVRDYLAMNLDDWRQFSDIVAINDFKPQRRIRYGGYGTVPTVAQGATYLPLTSPGDEEATYTPAKKGGTEDLTLETIKNDDVGAAQQIPTRMARGVSWELHKFVFDLINPAVNAAIYDSLALYHATHANTGTTALLGDAVAFNAARLRMKKQQQLSTTLPIGLRTGFLVGPSDLESVMYSLTMPAAGNANMVSTFAQSLGVKPVPVAYWTDTTDWVIVSKREDGVGLEVGFMDGRETPEAFVSDMSNVGSWFTNDKITFKIRFIWGAAITDFRFFDGSIVP